LNSLVVQDLQDKSVFFSFFFFPVTPSRYFISLWGYDGQKKRKRKKEFRSVNHEHLTIIKHVWKA
jgi:hypothetical protein